nr:hypothetical protein CFP56_16958 [Quercus suber]
MNSAIGLPLLLRYKIITKTEGYEKKAGLAKTDSIQRAVLGFGALYIVATKGNVFRFCDLPSELRIQILRISLEQEEHFIIMEHKTASGGKLNRAVQASFGSSRHPAHSGLIKDYQTDKWVGMDPSSFAILQTSRAMLVEAAPIAYGKNVFSFTSVGGCAMFLEGIGGMRKYLKHVSFDKMMTPLPQALGRVLSQLQVSTYLLSAEFDVYAAHDDPGLLIYFYTILLRKAYERSLTSGHVFNIAKAVRMTYIRRQLLRSDEDLVNIRRAVANALRRGPVGRRG